MIFFGGTSGNGCGVLRSQMPAGLPLLGGDGCQDDKFITDAGSQRATVPRRPAHRTPASWPARSQFYSRLQEPLTAQTRTRKPLHPVRLRRHEHPHPGDQGGARRQRRPAPGDSKTFRDAVVAQLHKRQLQRRRRHTSPSTATATPPTPASRLYKVSGGDVDRQGASAVDTSGKVSVDRARRQLITRGERTGALPFSLSGGHASER